MKTKPVKDTLSRRLRALRIRDILITFLVLLIIGGLPGLITMSGKHVSLGIVIQNSWWFFSYWFVIALAVCLFSAYQKYRAYDQPIIKLSEASKEVASGDFSVYVDPTVIKSQNPYFVRMVDDFNVMVQELGSLETMKTDFVSSVSHELKTPLAVIQNYTAVLQSGKLNAAEQDNYLAEINHASRELATTVTNILLLNKLDNQGIVPKTVPYNLVEQLADILMSFEALLDELELDVEVTMSDRVLIDFDANMLAIVWRNLLSNALKFSNKKGKLSLRQTVTDSEIIVEMKDTGIGMDEQTLNHLFDKFYQADTSRAQQGNGLGLALAKRVVELADGTITATSTLGVGSTFTVYLPVRVKQSTTPTSNEL